jgi:hypothetical protein
LSALPFVSVGHPRQPVRRRSGRAWAQVARPHTQDGRRSNQPLLDRGGAGALPDPSAGLDGTQMPRVSSQNGASSTSIGGCTAARARFCGGSVAAEWVEDVGACACGERASGRGVRSDRLGQDRPGGRQPQRSSDRCGELRKPVTEILDQSVPTSQRLGGDEAFEAPHRWQLLLERAVIAFHPMIHILRTTVFGQREHDSQRWGIAGCFSRLLYR